jgi:hypothetical protein
VDIPTVAREKFNKKRRRSKLEKTQKRRRRFKLRPGRKRVMPTLSSWMQPLPTPRRIFHVTEAALEVQ